MTSVRGGDTSVTTDRSWNVSLPADPDEVNVVPTVAGPGGASSVSILNPSLSARSPDQMRWFRRSAITSKTASCEALEVTEGCVRNPNDRSAMQGRLLRWDGDREEP